MVAGRLAAVVFGAKGCEPCPPCEEGQVLTPLADSCDCVADPAGQTPTPTATPPAVATVGACSGDCDVDGAIGIDELLAAVAMALGGEAAGGCTSADRDLDGVVVLGELIELIGAALDGCR
jgi:hypothetical protein